MTDLLDLLDRPSWQSRAACRGLDIGVMFPERHDRAGFRQARAICMRCEVRGPCLQWAVQTGETQHGIYGGFSPRERRQLRRELSPAARRALPTIEGILSPMLTNRSTMNGHAALSWEAAVTEGKRLVGRLDKTRFELGDLCCQLFPFDGARGRARLAGVRAFGEAVGVSGGAMIDYRSISHAWPPSTRHPGVTYSVYRHLLGRTDRAELLSSLVARKADGRVALSDLRAVDIPAGRTSAASIELRLTRLYRNVDSVSAAVIRTGDRERMAVLAQRLGATVALLESEATFPEPVEVAS